MSVIATRTKFPTSRRTGPQAAERTGHPCPRSGEKRGALPCGDDALQADSCRTPIRHARQIRAIFGVPDASRHEQRPGQHSRRGAVQQG